MQLLAPVGPVYQAGTLSGNPIAMTAGIATLDILSQPDTYEQLNDKAERFISRLQEALEPKGVVVNHVGNMFTPYFTGGNRPRNFQEVRQSNLDEFARFWRYMFNNGVYLSPSQFEADFISIQHTEEELDKVIELAREYKGGISN